MKVFVVGANGKIGQQLVRLLQENVEHSVRAMVRSEAQAKELQERGIEAAIVSLEGSVEDIAQAAEGCEALVFTAGSGGHTGYDKTLLIDLDGAAKTVEAAEKVGISRYIMVSALQAQHREKWNEDLKPYYVAKHYADKILEQSNLTYTIIRPGGLLNDQGTGKIKVAENISGGVIPREDVAKTILHALTEENTYNKSFDLVSGDRTIPDALQQL